MESFPNHFSQSNTPYSVWLEELRPRTCLLVHWLATLGAIPPVNESVSARASQFAEKRLLLGHLIHHNETVARGVHWLVDNDDFDIYVAHLMWLRFVEYVPRRFVLEDGRAKVLEWVRVQMDRGDLSDAETERELESQARRLHFEWFLASCEEQ